MDKNLKIAIILAATDKATATLNKAFANAQRHAKSLQEAGRSISEAGDRMLIAGGISTAFFAKTVSDAREAKMAQDKLILGFKTMGSTAEQAQKMVDMAGGMQFKLGVEDEDIMNVMGKLSTFKRTMTDSAIASGVFQRATQASFDMQAKGYGDAMSNVVQLGKALQNPMLGSQALSKAGAINKEDLPLIKYIQQTKGIPAAQKYVLDAIEKQVKGSAAAMADPVKVMELQMHEASESIGRSLLPTVTKLATSFGNFIPKISAFIDKHQNLIVLAAKAGVALLAFGAAMKVVGFVVSGVGTLVKGAGYAIKATSFIISNGGKIATLAVKGYEALKYGMFALQYAMNYAVLPALKSAGTAIVEFGATLLASPITWYIAAILAIGAAAYLIYKYWGPIKTFFINLWAKVKEPVMKFWNWLKPFLLNFTPVGLIIKYWKPLSGFFVNIWNNVKSVFINAFNWINNLAAKFWDAGVNIVKSVWQGMKTMAHKPVELIADMTAKIRAYLPFSPAKTGAFRDLHKVKIIETIAQSMKAPPAVAAMRHITEGMHSQLDSPAPSYSRGGGNTSFHFSPVINLHGGATQKDAELLNKNMQPQFRKWMREYEAQKERRSF